MIDQLSLEVFSIDIKSFPDKSYVAFLKSLQCISFSLLVDFFFLQDIRFRTKFLRLLVFSPNLALKTIIEFYN